MFYGSPSFPVFAHSNFQWLKIQCQILIKISDQLRVGWIVGQPGSGVLLWHRHSCLCSSRILRAPLTTHYSLPTLFSFVSTHCHPDRRADGFLSARSGGTFLLMDVPTSISASSAAWPPSNSNPTKPSSTNSSKNPPAKSPSRLPHTPLLRVGLLSPQIESESVKNLPIQLEAIS